MIISTKRRDILKLNKGSKRTGTDIYVALPKEILTFNIKDEFTINRVIDGFIMKRAGLDSKFIMKLHSNRWVRINRSCIGYELEGDYELEELDEDTLKFTKI